MKRTVELWSALAGPGIGGDPDAVNARASRLEADGWDGATLVDTQCVRGDVFVQLALSTQATKTLKLGTGTSNPATRHPSVIASATALLQILSNGRMSLGIGRGDSALASVGASPVPVALFEHALAMIQAYLKGESVPLEEAATMLAVGNKGFENLAKASAPEESHLRWLPKDFIKPDIEVSATGPKVIAAAARQADRISFALGANVHRLKWAVDVAREEIKKAGRPDGAVKLGAFIPLYPHSNLDVSRKLAWGMVALHSRFSVMNKKIVGPVSDKQREILGRVATAYDMKHHTFDESSLDEEYIDEFALVGDPSRCVDRLQEIMDLGLDRLHLWTSGDANAEHSESYTLAATKVLPRLSTVTA